MEVLLRPHARRSIWCGTGLGRPWVLTRTRPSNSAAGRCCAPPRFALFAVVAALLAAAGDTASKRRIVTSVHMQHLANFQLSRGHNCVGSGEDPLRGLVASAASCARKCDSFGESRCAGFVRVNGGDSDHQGKCFFRGGRMLPPVPTAVDSRDCYSRVALPPGASLRPDTGTLTLQLVTSDEGLSRQV